MVSFEISQINAPFRFLNLSVKEEKVKNPV